VGRWAIRSRKPAPAAPSVIDARLREIVRVSNALGAEYHTLYEVSLSSRSREAVKVTTSRTDPTGDIAGNQEAMRAHLARTDELIDQAFAKLDTAFGIIARTLEWSDPPDIPVVLDKKRITKAEYAEAVDYQARRNGHG